MKNNKSKERVCFILSTEDKHLLMIVAAKEGMNISQYIRKLLQSKIKKEKMI